MLNEEWYIGGLASVYLVKSSMPRLGSLGFYLTNRRIIGVSYSPVTERSLWIGVAALFLWVGLFVPLVVYSVIVRASELFWLPPVMGLGLFGLVWLMGPAFWFADRKVAREGRKTLKELVSGNTDFDIAISQIQRIEFLKQKVALLNTEHRITIKLRDGTSVLFSSGKKQFRELILLFRSYSSAVSPLEIVT